MRAATLKRARRYLRLVLVRINGGVRCKHRNRKKKLVCKCCKKLVQNRNEKLTILLWHASQFVDLRHIGIFWYHVDVFFLDELGKLSLLVFVLSVRRVLVLLLLFRSRVGTCISLCLFLLFLSSRLVLIFSSLSCRGFFFIQLLFRGILLFVHFLLLHDFLFLAFLLGCISFGVVCAHNFSMLQLLMLVDVEACDVL